MSCYIIIILDAIAIIVCGTVLCCVTLSLCCVKLPLCCAGLSLSGVELNMLYRAVFLLCATVFI